MADWNAWIDQVVLLSGLPVWDKGLENALARACGEAGSSRAESFKPYSFVACHRPLHGLPADAAFHRPDPVLPTSWPFA